MTTLSGASHEEDNLCGLFFMQKKTKSVNTLTLPLDLEIICYVSTAQLRRLLF